MIAFNFFYLIFCFGGHSHICELIRFLETILPRIIYNTSLCIVNTIKAAQGVSVRGGRVRYVTVSIPAAITRTIDELIEELGYWPSRSAFVREACLENVRKERDRLRKLRKAKEGTAQSMQGGEPCRGTNLGISPR